MTALERIEAEKINQTGKLDLSKFQLTELPKKLLELTQLTYLNLFNNQISDISFLKNLTNLKSLDLEFNQISDISFLENLNNLHTLDLRSNQILDYSFLENLPNLHTLDLRSNQISDISFLENLPNLHTLDLRSDQISDISFLENLPNLHTLYLSYNQISDISFLENLTNLHTLDLSSNQISDYSFLENLTNLHTLDLRSNQISDISFLESLPNLHTLNLRSNQISDISFLENLPNLHTLDLSYNQISNISFLENLPNLQKLDLESNQILDINSLKNLPKLKSLDLESNQISDITPLLPLIRKGEMPISLKKYDWTGKINLDNNPIETPPIEIVKQGNSAIIQYYDNLKKDKTIELQEAKMLILGEGGVGKTSLLTKLLNEAADLPKEEETTKGIDIHEYYFKTKDNKKFRINMWDFGGQEIYKSTHQFFLTKRSLYVLVDSTRINNQNIGELELKYWLDTIRLFGGESPIVIVQNEVADRSKDLSLKNIQSQFSNVKGSYATNLKTCRNLAETKNALEFYIQQLPHIGTKLPEQWVKIRETLEHLERAGTNYISREAYFDICAKHKITEKDNALVLSQYLHDLGVILHFQSDDLLRKTLILNNEWATDAVYNILDCEKVKKAKGRFTRTELKTIWSDAKYDRMHPELLALMRNFDLCYQLPNSKQTYLAPELFPKTPPDYTWNAADNLIVKLKYGFMPKGLITRLIVRLHKYVKNSELAWKNGVILERGKTKAEIASLYAQQEIRIRVKGLDNKGFLDIILEEFERLHDFFKGIVVDKWIPCSCDICKKTNWKGKHYFKYQVLKSAYHKNIPNVQCQVSFDMINVYRLIHDTLMAKNMTDFYNNKEKLKEMVKKQEHWGAGDNVGGSKNEYNYYGSHPKPEKAVFDFETTQREPIDKEAFKKAFSDGKLDQIFDKLPAHTKDATLLKEILKLKQRWKKNEKGLLMKRISSENHAVENEDIKEILLDWIFDW